MAPPEPKVVDNFRSFLSLKLHKAKGRRVGRRAIGDALREASFSLSRMGARRAGGWLALGLVVILGWLDGAAAVFDLSAIPMSGCAADGLCDVLMTDGRRIETPQV